jgi:hypothetical protein
MNIGGEVAKQDGYDDLSVTVLDANQVVYAILSRGARNRQP